MTFSTAVKTCFPRSFTFSGRASRSEYWLRAVPIVALLAGAVAFDVMVLGPTVHHEFSVSTNLATGEETKELVTVTNYGPRLASSVVSLLVLFPFISVLTRRVHDIGYPSWYAWLAVFLAFFCGPLLSMLVGVIALLPPKLAVFITILVGVPQVLMSFLAFAVIVLWGTTPSEPGSNEYGPNQLEVQA